jgi:hypothetical protein
MSIVSQCRSASCARDTAHLGVSVSAQRPYSHAFETRVIPPVADADSAVDRVGSTLSAGSAAASVCSPLLLVPLGRRGGMLGAESSTMIADGLA